MKKQLTILLLLVSVFSSINLGNCSLIAYASSADYVEQASGDILIRQTGTIAYGDIDVPTSDLTFIEFINDGDAVVDDRTSFTGSLFMNLKIKMDFPEIPANTKIETSIFTNRGDMTNFELYVQTYYASEQRYLSTYYSLVSNITATEHSLIDLDHSFYIREVDINSESQVFGEIGSSDGYKCSIYSTYLEIDLLLEFQILSAYYDLLADLPVELATIPDVAENTATVADENVPESNQVKITATIAVIFAGLIVATLMFRKSQYSKLQKK